MTSSTVESNPVTNNTYGPRGSLKWIKNHKTQKRSIRSWRSETQQTLYRSKLLQALQRVRLGSSESVHSARLRGRAVREAADRVLAMTAKGRTRWSRAILTNQLKNKSMTSNLRRRRVIASTMRNSRFTKPMVGVLRLQTNGQRKARDIRRLVPGCRNQPLPVVPEEVVDYISALDMQVKVMAAVVEFFSSSGSGYVAGDVNVSESQGGISREPPGL